MFLKITILLKNLLKNSRNKRFFWFCYWYCFSFQWTFFRWTDCRLSIFRNFFREKFVHVFRFFREKKGCEKCEKCEKKVIFSAISVRFSENSRNFQVALGSSLRSWTIAPIYLITPCRFSCYAESIFCMFLALNIQKWCLLLDI